MDKDITPEVAAQVAAELLRRHPVKYADLPPGEDAAVDAYNLFLATLGGQGMMADAIIDHQIPNDDLRPLLGATVGLLVTLFRDGIASASHPLYLEGLRVVAEQRAKACRDEIGLPDDYEASDD